MAINVTAAFDEFLENHVNLNKTITGQAYTSRDWLLARIADFPNDGVFPVLYSDADIAFGSFARKTKKRPLDDIDYMVGLSAERSSYFTEDDGSIQITVHEDASRLQKLTNDNSELLNSRKVVNQFVKKMSGVPQYDSAEIKRNGEAACLALKSYDWNFDIVPCFITQNDDNGNSFYLIPDGNGKWKKTDPRIDRARVTRTNQANDGKILNIIRLMKYWNRRPTMPSMSSYLLECMILNYYSVSGATSYIEFDVRSLLNYISSNIFSTVYDPKGFQGNINDVPFNDKMNISMRAQGDYEKAQRAIHQETKEGSQRKAINTWKEVFGSDFPDYG